jgi:hypothetical protein
MASPYLVVGSQQTPHGEPLSSGVQQMKRTRSGETRASHCLEPLKLVHPVICGNGSTLIARLRSPDAQHAMDCDSGVRLPVNHLVALDCQLPVCRLASHVEAYANCTASAK